MQHIVLIGFKNSGKSTIGKGLAKALGMAFVDLDDNIVEVHETQKGEKLSCRGIMERHGEKYFRELEASVLSAITASDSPMVLAVGGGTPMSEQNRALIKRHLVIEISAPKSIVFERIMINGKPAFFPKDEEPITSFKKLWKEREPIFKNLANISVENTGSVDEAVNEILKKLP